MQDRKPVIARLQVRVQPRAARNEIMRTGDQTLKIKVTAPPTDGRANQQVVRVLADRLKIAQSRITIIRGHRSRDKHVLVEGLSRAEIESRLPA